MSNHQVLNNADHKDLRVRLEPSAEAGDAVMGTLITPAEFRRVQAEFPIVFRKNPENDSVTALALFGFENGENLFLEDGKWDARYRPLSLAIQPFLVGRPANGEGQGQVHIDMDHPRIATDGEGTRVFDEDGGTTPFLEEIAEKLGELDQGAPVPDVAVFELVEGGWVGSRDGGPVGERGAVVADALAESGNGLDGLVLRKP